MKSRVFVSVSILLFSSLVFGADRPSRVPASCSMMCQEGQLNRETCTCETANNPRPAKRIWPAVENENEDEVVWDEDDE